MSFIPAKSPSFPGSRPLPSRTTGHTRHSLKTKIVACRDAVHGERSIEGKHSRDAKMRSHRPTRESLRLTSFVTLLPINRTKFQSVRIFFVRHQLIKAHTLAFVEPTLEFN
ncbi:hypothetical protein PIIN_02111 [Serendipita indica DSM 11827]|uniref:Uncharacterized protein n=1 Tax=Serendipita indica (strain DSM 11827) TaxID=1109443 RepID=G4TA72_SERID|nr:hypothetical protein PIIN_02111 [Serendipita indica DSM 11827]